MAVVSMRELLEGGVHFGHQTRRWNPKMRRYIFGERGGIYIIDLQKSLALLEDAAKYSRNVAERGGSILFVGTKKQAQDVVEQEARRVGMPYVNQRWLGGLLTNWRTISQRIERLHELRRLRDEGQLELLPSKERMSMLSELEKLDTNLGGVANMRSVPDAIFVLDLNKEEIAVREAAKLGIPVVAVIDSNSDPSGIAHPIPGNDDSIRAIQLYCDLAARAVLDGLQKEMSEQGEDIGALAEQPAEDITVAATVAEPPAPEAPADVAPTEAPAESPAAEAAADAAPAEALPLDASANTRIDS